MTDEVAETPHVRRTRLQTLRSPRRPRIWFEVLLIAVSYWTYSLIRNAVPEQKTQALHNADWIWRVEQTLGIAVEQSVNHAVNSVTWLIVSMNYYYATLHFIVTIGVLVWLYRWHPGRYAAARLALFATTGVALVGYYLYPLAPPRLMSNQDFVDTVLVHHTWGSMASGNLKNMSNQYAAMPSMHIGWSLWCGLIICAVATAPGHASWACCTRRRRWSSSSRRRTTSGWTRSAACSAWPSASRSRTSGSALRRTGCPACRRAGAGSACSPPGPDPAAPGSAGPPPQTHAGLRLHAAAPGAAGTAHAP